MEKTFSKGKMVVRHSSGVKSEYVETQVQDYKTILQQQVNELSRQIADLDSDINQIKNSTGQISGP